MLSSSYSPSIPGILWVKRRLVMFPLPVTVKVVKLPLSSVNKLSRLLLLNTVCIDITLFFGLSTVSTNNLIRSEEHTSELQSRGHLVCRLLLEKKQNQNYN